MLTLQWLEQPEADPGPFAGDPTPWQTLQVGRIPLRRPALIRLVAAQATMLPRFQRLLAELRQLLTQMADEPLAPPWSGPLLPAALGANLLEVVLADGHTPVSPQPRWQQALAGGGRAWVLPLLPAEPRTAYETLPSELQRSNIAFWHGEAMAELALTLLARAGVSDLDRRLFISYRRSETQALANQLFAALTARNVSVFLDTVSVEPGVDFQTRLFEQLADQSMLLALQSASFSHSTWTRQEVEFAVANGLPLLILRLPGLDKSDLLPGSRAGEQLDLEPADLQPGELQAGGQGPGPLLSAEALERFMAAILRVHDLELVGQLGQMRQRTLEALRRHGISGRLAQAGVAIHGGGSPPRWSLVPCARPPGIAELYAASSFAEPGHGRQRVVVGRAGSLPLERRQQMDWAIDGRNVQYCDITMLDALIAQLEGPQP
jgi:hypothetical protein